MKTRATELPLPETRIRRWIIPTILLFLTGCANDPKTVRFATFNASLNRDNPGQLASDLSTPDNSQAKNVAEIIQRVRPDVILINEFDYDESGAAADLFQRNYLSVPQNGALPIDYPHRVQLPVNTGIPSGFDLDNDGQVVTTPGTRGYGNDCFGFGQFPGQYGMLLLSRYPLGPKEQIETFQLLLWKDLPDAMLPTKPDGSPWYSEEELAVLRLSSKSHWDVPVRIGRATIHVLASHPTPPAFDGPENRNGKRNHDEIRLWALYIGMPAEQTRAPEAGNFCSTLSSRSLPGEPQPNFVIMGDLNADPNDGASIPDAIQQLLGHGRVNASFTPRSDGGAEASQAQAGKNSEHQGDPQYDTADFSDADTGPGNLRCDYVLPSVGLQIRDGGVFWPASTDPLARLVQMQPAVASSDHRLVWIDIPVPRK